MNTPQNSVPAKIALLCVCIALAATLEVFFVCQYWASRLAKTPSRESLVAAARLDPWNAEYPYLLARFDVMSGLDFREAAEALRRCVALNPYRAGYWLELAGAYEVLGNQDAQEEALQRAGQMEPSSPTVAWQIGNYQLVQGKFDQALTQFAVIERYYPPMMPEALDVSWHATHDVDLMLRYIPRETAPLVDFLGLLTNQNELPASAKVWDSIVAMHRPVPISSVLPYIDTLLSAQNRQVDQAERVWKDLLQMNPAMAPYSQEDNLVANGGFEHDIIGGGFEWTYYQVPNVSLSQDGIESHGGSRALSVSFDGENIFNFGVLQVVPVDSDTTYLFTAYAKANMIEGPGGPRLAVIDPYAPSKVYFVGPAALGSSGWRAEGGEFRTGPDTRVVAITVIRQGSPARVRGTYLIDDVSLTKAPGAPK